MLIPPRTLAGAALAALLAGDWDVIFLDEPTNQSAEAH